MVEILVNQVVEKAAAASAYKARDVVNAPAIKQRIKERSAERGDAADVAAWLGNHFYRHVVGNLQADEPAVLRIADVRQLQELAGRQEPPAWALERLERRQVGFELPELWWVQPDSAALLALETRLVEFLSTRKGTSLEGKLQRVNCPQALARWTLEHLAFEKNRTAAGLNTARAPCTGCCAASTVPLWSLTAQVRRCARKWLMKAR